MLRFRYIAVVLLFLSIDVFSQPSEKKLTPNDYISRYKEDAIKEMYRFGVPASITLAQGMLESGNGNSALSVYANNHFGIKCHKDWTGPSYILDDDEKNECFRKYQDVLDSYSDHSQFLRNRDRYAFLFELAKTDYKGWARGLKEAGYATHPKYAEQLIDLIEQYKLYELDKDVVLTMRNVKEKAPQVKLNLRQVLKFNHTKFIIAKPRDSFYKIASDFDLELSDLFKYNDFNKGETIVAYEKVYVEAKRRKALEPYHVVTKGETMESISQLHGIKLSSLYKKNRIKPSNGEPKVGTVLYLRKRKSKSEAAK
ncbi:MAG TPA: glucosaminidase domain-containing protein [Bacteroidia bacterium]|jgi:LysM repeat protein|nr:glucosaminidase domain-containing protein [Bacteroidia bacterium]